MLAPWVISHFPDHKFYVEPFGGSAAVLLRKPRCYAEVYNDLHQGVVNLFRVLRDPELAEQLRQAAGLTPFSRDEFFAAYEPSSDPVESALRMVVIGTMGFGSDSAGRVSGFRANSNRSGSTPAQDWRRWPERVAALSERLRGVIIENRDYQEVMKAHDRPDTLHYVDPPYVLATRGRPGSYTHDFTDYDHIKLIEFLRTLSGMVVLSGYPSALYDEYLPDWQQSCRDALADGARKRTEVLWLNSAAASRQKTPGLFDANPATIKPISAAIPGKTFCRAGVADD